MADEKAMETVDVMGVEASYDPACLGSPTFVLAMGELSDDSLPDADKLVANARLMKALFGQDRYEVMDAVAERGVGFTTWLAAFFEAVGAKN